MNANRRVNGNEADGRNNRRRAVKGDIPDGCEGESVFSVHALSDGIAFILMCVQYLANMHYSQYVCLSVKSNRILPE